MATKNIPTGKRILVFNVNWLGDVLFSTAAFRALRQAYPDAYIACIVHPRAKEILQGNPNLDEIIVFDEKDKEKHLLNKFKFVSKLAKKNFDTVYMFHRSVSRLMLMVMSNIPNRIGYKAKKRSFVLLTKRISLPKVKMHRVEYFLNILKTCGTPCEAKFYEFFIDMASQKKILDFFQDQGINKGDLVIALNPGGNWFLKRWIPERFSELANSLIKEFKAKIIITGSANDAALAESIGAGLVERPIIACGKTSLKELGALLERCNLFISADSGPMHIAVSLGVPTIALFGPTSPEITGPIGKGKVKVIQKDVGCEIPCYKVDCQDSRCMKAINTEDVLEAVREIINK